MKNYDYNLKLKAKIKRDKNYGCRKKMHTIMDKVFIKCLRVNFFLILFTFLYMPKSIITFIIFLSPF